MKKQQLKIPERERGREKGERGDEGEWERREEIIDDDLMQSNFLCTIRRFSAEIEFPAEKQGDRAGKAGG